MRLLLLALALAAPATAQEQVYRLSEEDKQAALEAASRQPEKPLPLPVVDGRAPGSPDRRAHGEVGMMIGTGGSRAIWGSTSIPLGDSGSASLGLGTGRFPGGFGSPQDPLARTPR
ncbi:MAG: hypothetical protein ACMVO5_07025 [Polymorphobacter sp.]|uniref:hypothetical protein n=1 Tax=Polymorphobacter sp. TaxID=1909290 RepID=UPI003A88459D